MSWIMRRPVFISIFDSQMGLYAFLSQMSSWRAVRMKRNIRLINYSAPPSCWEASLWVTPSFSDKVHLCSTPLLYQLSKEGVLLDRHHWNLLAHHPEGRQANTFICHSKTVLSCCWPLDASRNVMRDTKGLLGKYNGQLGINRPIQKCVLVWKLSVHCQFPRGVVDGRHPKCLWVQSERPLSNQSNETCDLWQVGTALGPFSSRKKRMEAWSQTLTIIVVMIDNLDFWREFVWVSWAWIDFQTGYNWKDLQSSQRSNQHHIKPIPY